MATTEHTGKPVRIDYNHEWPSNHGGINYDFDIEFEDGTIGQFTTANREQTKFTLNKEVKYTATARTGNFGPKIDVVKAPYTGRGGSGGGRSSSNTGGRGLSPEVEASITMSVCLDAAATCILKTGKSDQVKEDLVALHSIANKFFKHIMAKSNGDRQLSINYQSRLKEVVGILMDYPSLAIKSTDDILKYVDLEVAFLQMKMTESK